MANPILTLTTDFGILDHYVAAMKGVIWSVCPQAQIADVSHSVEPYAISSAAYLLAQEAPCFPPGTVHVAVVDPGVGTARRALYAEAGGQRYVAPDNGVLTLVLKRGGARLREITNQALFRHPVSRTFHGRDVFAPVAAALAAGAAPETLGPETDAYIQSPFAAPRPSAGGAFTGAVLHVDHFGNVVTNFGVEWAARMRRGFRLNVGQACVTALAGAYEEGPAGLPFTIAGSAGYMEISIRQASAAAALECRAGSPVVLELAK